GPDAEGIWRSLGGEIQLAFCRLAIIDPTPAGTQPMVSADGRSALVLNGEIYNFRELRGQLESLGHRFRSRADSEVLLAALTQWGRGALDRLNGMFAFAWYDGERRTLLLARDHAGIKPLYWSRDPATGAVAFASQLDALRAAPWARAGALRQDALHLYLRLHHLPAPYTLFENCWQLPPGHTLSVHADGPPQLERWWRLPENPEPDLRGPAAADALASALDGAVQRHRIADVPLGVFLSGGVDSPLISAIAREQAGPGLQAFTIANPGWAQDEGPDAERYARALDVRFIEHRATGEEALAAVSAVREAQYEPFADFSIVPTLMVSKLARERVTVALSGDGGDELFFGYERPASLLRNAGDWRLPWLARRLKVAIGSRFASFGAPPSGAIAHRSPGAYYFAVNSRFAEADVRMVAPGLAGLPEDFHLYDPPPFRDPLALANFSRRVEFEGQLQRGLKKVDMASMYHSLEVRTPMLDREVIEVSLRIDPFDNLREGQRKALLRDQLARHVPREIIPAPKRGFAVPLGDWLRGSLRSTAEAALSSPALFATGLFDRRGVERYWHRHLSGARDEKWGIWTLMSLAWWLERNG
ncbi:MAG TPA: asparagine synthase (glutamine-hydrolyzing), partial [bacterium]|nr:asparagine synthase (glutamine-hydrolyzing) [bacterium]